jgi:hypothetical protein
MKMVEEGHEHVPARLRIWSAIASALLCLAAMSSATPVGATIAKASTTPHGWVAVSAYGLQLSVPKSWTVLYFKSCPGGDPGTLMIGTPTLFDVCGFDASDANVVTMQPGNSGAVRDAHEKQLVVHGLSVTSYSIRSSVTWEIGSKGVVITATGPRVSAVLHTLTLSTLRAQAAPGVLMGTEYLVALMRTPVTGPVSVARLDTHGPGLPAAQAFDGQFSDTLPPGRYRLTGHAGNAPCPSITASVQSGRTTNLPAIDCQGE